MTSERTLRILRLASFFALAALALMVWSLFDPRPIPVIVAMSVGQLLGTLSFGAFLFVVVADLRSMNAIASERSAGAGAKARDDAGQVKKE